MQKKKLLLLSAIVLLMGTNSYGTLYPNAGNNYTISQEDIKESDLKGNTVISIAKGNYGIVNESVNIDIKHDGTNEKKIINMSKETPTDKESINKGKLKGEATSNGNLIVVGIQGGKFINDGTIGIAGTNGKGISITGATGTAENNGTIEVSGGATGVCLNHADATFTNNETGIITVTGIGSKGIEVNKGVATNDGNIVVVGDDKLTSGKQQAIGVKVNKDGNFTNSNTITVVGTADAKESSYQAKGILVEVGGTATNEKDGQINVSSAGIGALVKGTFTNDGTINVNGTSSKGILITGGKVTNSGEININNGAVGVELADGLFINSGKINGEGIAIKSSKENNTVYLQNGSEIEGKIVGNTGIDILALEGNKYGGEYIDLDVEGYEALVVRDGDVTVNNSSISLDYNKGTKDYLDEAKNKLDIETGAATSGNLTMNDSKLVVNFGDSLKNGEALENPIIDVGTDGKLKVDGDTSFIFNSSDNRSEYNINDILGLGEGQLELTDGTLNGTIIWDYDINENGDLIAKKQNYNEIITNSYISDFANALDKARPSFGDPTLGDPNNKFFQNVIAELESLKNAKDFTRGLAQLSGGIHGYTVDIAAINSRNLVNTMKNKALTREYLTTRPVNSWYQDVVYLNNNQRLGGLMSGSYQESGVLGISEKQSFSNGRLGFVYGGSKGKAKFDGGESGEIATDNIYVGLYYNHDLSEKLALNTNFSFVYGHNSVNRRVRIGKLDETLKSHYPTYAMGIGTSAIYTIKDDAKNRALFYAGIDVNRIMQGNINEKEEVKGGSSDVNLMVKNGGANEFSYYSITPSAGFMVQNTGYIFDKKYLVGADLAWETELGNIKDGKRMNMVGIKDQYKVGTMERENIFSTSIFGQLDMTESLALNGRYTSSISDEYDADMVTVGMTYKMDTMLDVPVLGPLVSGIENSRSLFSSDRWGGTFALMMEAEDDSNRVYYSTKDGSLNSSDYATSMQMKPKFTLSLNDKKTNWSYYFEGYYKANDFLKDTRAGEADQKATRLHGEARWSDSYSKGRYGMAFGYRHETADKPVANQYMKSERGVRGVHQLRLTPNFSYNLGHGFTMNFKTTSIFEYNYIGVREGQMDFLMENEHTLVYTGFMPRWTLRVGYFREDRWMDSDSNKRQWLSKDENNKPINDIVELDGAGRYQLNQIRPSATYYLGNGDSVTLSLRIPLGNGAWYNELGTDKKASESYETRYSIDYNHVVTPGFSVFGGITFLDIKTKNTDRTNANFGKVSRAYSFRPKLGFSYSF